MCFKFFTDCINKSYRTPEATVEDVSQRVRRVYKSLILAKTLRMRSSMRCLGGLVILVLGVVHILRNHFWGSRETPPLCNIVIIWAYPPYVREPFKNVLAEFVR